jgi:hypothetical protein
MLCIPWSAGVEVKRRGAGLLALLGTGADLSFKEMLAVGSCSATLALRLTSVFSSVLRGVVVRRKLEAALRGT